MSLYKKVEKFVVNAWGEDKSDIFHAKRTVYWIKKLEPNCDEALLIAGFAHDVERAFNGDWKRGSDNIDEIKKHENMSADVVEKFLRKESASEDIVKRVKMLILKHEEGGNEDQNILCDADCLAFFEDKALRFAKRFKGKGQEEWARKKLGFCFARISLDKARGIARKWYDEAMEVLG